MSKKPKAGSPVEQAPPWHALTIDQILEIIGDCDLQSGLISQEAASRLARFGPNELGAEHSRGILPIVAAQFKSFIVWLLLLAAIISGLFGEWIDAIAIGTIVVLNALIGAFQEYSAEKSIAALRKLTAPTAKVLRDAKVSVIPASQVVPGDVLMIESGDLVVADARVMEASSLSCIEKALTGESESVEKTPYSVPANAPLAERSSMLYMSTAIATGTARAIVVATGMRTEFGSIAALVQTASQVETTPLQAKLTRVGQVLVFTCLAIIAGLFGLGLARREPLLELFLTSVSLAVAAVPEGLPAVVTVALAIGVRRMARRKALIRRLASVETLGSTSVICTDKTGTLTMGQMTVRVLAVPTADGIQTLDVTGEGYDPRGAITLGGHKLSESDPSPVRRLAQNLVGATNALISQDDEQFEAVGDPTEAAMVVAGMKAGITRADLDATAPKIAEFPFDSDRKRSSVIRRFQNGKVQAMVNGSPESLIELCTHLALPNAEIPLTPESRKELLALNDSFASRSLRVIACAARRFQEVPTSADLAERELTFIGLVGMHDPPREEVRDAVANCVLSGIRVVMITGDQPRTAIAIAHDLRIASDDDLVLSGAELASMDDTVLADRVRRVAVYARVTAADKLRIVRAWQETGAVVAMTGDGVNDAPALKGADVGVAMGRSGTEVAKQAADIIVTDDNFATIVVAVEQGRGVYDNIRKTMQYLMGGNAAELLLIGACLISGLPMPLLPVQILWINLVTDGLPALFLAADPVHPEVMRRQPRRREASIMDRSFLITMCLTALLTAGVAFGVYLYGLRFEGDAMARTHAFAVLVFAELFRSFSCRSQTIPVWRMNWGGNLLLIGVVTASLTLQIWSHHNETLASLMRTLPLSWSECLTVLLIATLPALILEIVKLRPSLDRFGTRQ